MGIFDVPPDMLIEEVAKELKTKLQKPEFTLYVKTGAHAERAPNNPDWFFMRNASILYQIYKHGATGTGSLRSYYGGRKNRGVKPERKKKASGKVIRVCLQSLEKEGLLKKEKKGRTVSGKGEKLLFEKAKQIEIVVKEQKQKKEQEQKERLETIRARREKEMKQVQAKKIEEQKARAKEQKPQEGKPQTHATEGSPGGEKKPMQEKKSEPIKKVEKPEQGKVKDERGRTEEKKA